MSNRGGEMYFCTTKKKWVKENCIISIDFVASWLQILKSFSWICVLEFTNWIAELYCFICLADKYILFVDKIFLECYNKNVGKGLATNTDKKRNIIQPPKVWRPMEVP